MLCKCKIVLIWFLKPHAHRTLDDAEVVEILLALMGLEWGW